MPPDRPLNALDDFELLQVLVGRRLREQEAPYETLRDLVDRTLDQLRHELGVGPAGARRIAAAVELHRRVSRARHDRAPMRSPEEVLALLGPELATLEVERFLCLPLDARSRLIGKPLVVSVGDVDGTEAGPRAFFRAALRTGATSVIAAHNHPTSEVTPSQADHAVTRRLIAAGRQVDVPLVDHVIIGSAGRFCSLRRERPDLWSGS